MMTCIMIAVFLVTEIPVPITIVSQGLPVFSLRILPASLRQARKDERLSSSVNESWHRHIQALWVQLSRDRKGVPVRGLVLCSGSLGPSMGSTVGWAWK